MQTSMKSTETRHCYLCLFPLQTLCPVIVPKIIPSSSPLCFSGNYSQACLTYSIVCVQMLPFQSKFAEMMVGVRVVDMAKFRQTFLLHELYISLFRQHFLLHYSDNIFCCTIPTTFFVAQFRQHFLLHNANPNPKPNLP